LSLWQDVRTNMRIVTGSRSPQNDARFNLNRFRDNRRVNTASRPTQRSHCDHTTVTCLLRCHHTCSRRPLAGQSRQSHQLMKCSIIEWRIAFQWNQQKAVPEAQQSVIDSVITRRSPVFEKYQCSQHKWRLK
jgi:hypothetical protein